MFEENRVLLTELQQTIVSLKRDQAERDERREEQQRIEREQRKEQEEEERRREVEKIEKIERIERIEKEMKMEMKMEMEEEMKRIETNSILSPKVELLQTAVKAITEVHPQEMIGEKQTVITDGTVGILNEMKNFINR